MREPTRVDWDALRTTFSEFYRPGFRSRAIGLAGHQAAQLSERAYLFQQPAFGRDSEPLFQSRGQLHAAQAVQVQIFGQPQFVPASAGASPEIETISASSQSAEAAADLARLTAVWCRSMRWPW